MAELHYTIGDATEPKTDGPAIIAHVCNDQGGWGSGFVMALSAKWEEPESLYHTFYRNGLAVLGAVHYAEVEAGNNDVWVANMIAQHGYKSVDNLVPLGFAALRACLQDVADVAHEWSATVHMPRIGCGLGGALWEDVETLVYEGLVEKGISVVVYDLAPPLSSQFG